MTLSYIAEIVFGHDYDQTLSLLSLAQSNWSLYESQSTYFVLYFRVFCVSKGNECTYVLSDLYCTSLRLLIT